MAENNDGFTINVNSPGNFIAKGDYFHRTREYRWR